MGSKAEKEHTLKERTLIVPDEFIAGPLDVMLATYSRTQQNMGWYRYSLPNLYSSTGVCGGRVGKALASGGSTISLIRVNELN